MNLSELQADLRHFADERDWQPFHTPKNLTTALMVEAAELAEIFQWMTAEESRLACRDSASRERVGEEVADVLLYLLQVADHCQIDIAQAVENKLARNASKYPAKRTIPRMSPTRTGMPGTHVLLDYENVQPTEDELRAMVPDAGQVWVFHGPQQRQVEQRFASFGADVTSVAISKTGKNVLAKQAAAKKAAGKHPALEQAASKKAAAGKKTPAAPTLQKLAPPGNLALAKKAVAKLAGQSVLEEVVQVAGLADGSALPAQPPPASPALVGPSSVSASLLEKITGSLRRMGDKRPAKPVSLQRALKSFLGAQTGDESIEVALNNLIAAGVVSLDAKNEVSYPEFGPQKGAGLPEA